MTNPAAEARAKAQERWPGATVVERGRKFIRHQHPTNPGRFMLDHTTGPMHYGSGEDQEIDTAWQVSGGAWDHEATANNFHCYVRDSVPVSYRYEDVATGHFVELTVNAIEWANDEGQSEAAASFSQVTPAIDDDTITWPNIATGWHVAVQAQTARLAKKLTIDSLSDLGAPTIGGTNPGLRFSFIFQRSSGLQIWIGGEQWNEANNTWIETVGDIEFRDETSGDPIFWFIRPAAWDAAGDDLSVTQRVRRAGVNFYAEVKTPWSWLQAATYPISIDPSIDENSLGNNDNAWETGDDVSVSTLRIRATSNTTPGSEQYGGAHFNGIALDGTETIDAGTVIQVTAFSTSLDDPYTNLHCHDVDDSPDFASPNDDVYNRAYTTAYTLWNETGIGDTGYSNSPDIDTEVQEVIDRPSWSSGNDMTVLFRGTNDVTNAFHMFSYQNDSAKAPKLHIEYSTGGAAESILQSAPKVVRQPIPPGIFDI